MRYWLAILMAAVAWGQEPGTATVHGRVVIQVNQKPVTATISFDGREARAGADGLYQLAGVPAGSYVMEVRSLGFKTLYINVNLKAGDDVELPVAEVRVASMCGLSDEPTLQLRWLRDERQVGVLHGTMVGLRRKPLSGVGVTVTDARGDMARTVTDGTGRFEFLLKPGSYGLRFDLAGYEPVSFHTSAVAGLEMDLGEQFLFPRDPERRDSASPQIRYCE